MALNAALNEGKLQYTEDHQPAAAAVEQGFKT